VADPNHVLIEDAKLVLVLPHKSACSSVKVALTAALGYPKAQSPHDLPAPCRYIPTTDIPSDCLVVGVLREPHARVLSGWRWLRTRGFGREKGPGDFIEFLLSKPDSKTHAHLRSQAFDVMTGDVVLPSRWLYVEHLDDDWNSLCHRQGWLPTPMTRMNWQGNEELGDERLAEYESVIRQRFSQDFWLYDTQSVRRCGVKELS
jgi:hypothetical protein